MGAMGADPRENSASLLQMHNEGPAQIAAKISGVKEGQTKDDSPYFTNNEAMPWPDAAHSKNVGGLPLVSDTFLLQKQQTFNRSKNLEREFDFCFWTRLVYEILNNLLDHIGMVHPAGSGAFGYFEATKDMSNLTKVKATPGGSFQRISCAKMIQASIYTKPGKRTPIFLRFSTVTFGKEFPDSGRNPRGFAIKHYTEDGNYDLVGLNWVS